MKSEYDRPDSWIKPGLSPRNCAWTTTTSDACGTARGRRSKNSPRLKMAALAPIPKASETIATRAKPGFWRNVRRAKRRSLSMIPYPSFHYEEEHPSCQLRLSVSHSTPASFLKIAWRQVFAFEQRCPVTGRGKGVQGLTSRLMGP